MIMKFNYFLKSLALVALMALVVNVKAAEFPVANGATDTQLAAALDQAEDGDIIVINGWVTINQEVEITKNVTIKAGVANAGFEGGGETRLFFIHPEPVAGAKLVFEDLGFMGGYNVGTDLDVNAGGAAKIDGGCVVEFIFCYFDTNEAGRGGAFYIAGSEEDDPEPTTVFFRGCDATNNRAYGLSGEESRAGYLLADGYTHIVHEYCKITANQSIGGRGGAFCYFGGTQRFFYTLISDNKAGNWDDEKTKLDAYGNPGGDGPYEGGVAFILRDAAVTFESCGIIANKSYSHAAAFFGSGADINITFINSTVTLNEIVQDGRAPIWSQGGGTYTFVNSLFVGNVGVNSGNGAGFDGNNVTNVQLNIFNSIFERNICSNSEGAVDIRAIPNYATQLSVKNSLIGLIQGDDSGVIPSDNPDIPTKSNIRLYKLADEASQPEYTDPEFKRSGVDYAEGVRYSRGFDMPYYLLQEGSTVTKLGDPALLANYDTMSDLFGREREVAADGSITAAPTLASTQDGYDDRGWENNLITGIVSPKISLVKENVRVIASANGILGVDFGDLRGHAKGTLVSIAGQEVEKVFDINVVGKGYYNMHVVPGMYILKVEIGGKTYAQKLIVTQ